MKPYVQVFFGLGLAAALSSAAQRPVFVDATSASGLDFIHFNGMSGRLYYVEVVGAGGALFDYDNDGDLDLYLVQGRLLGDDVGDQDAIFPWVGDGPPRDRLFRNDLEVAPNGERRLRFVDVTEASGIRAKQYGMGAAVGDFDNDGWPDLYTLNFGRNELWRNRGDGTFEDVASEAGVADQRWSVSATFSDYDGDGWLDLYVVNYLEYSFVAHKTCLTERGEPDYCLPSAYRPATDRLYRNRGDGTFEDRTRAAGLGGASNGLGVVGADLNGDGRLDFYVANDLMENQLLVGNAGGTFTDDGLLSGAALNADGRAEASMGVDAGDADGDGDLDLFLTHFRRESNTFYRNRGDLFEDATVTMGLAESSFPYTTFGTGYLDYDGDGWLDLVTASGAVTYRPGVDRTKNPFSLDEPNQLFHNLDGKRFADVSESAGPAFARSEVSRATLLGDLDNDGDTDLVVTNNSGPARVLLNQVGSEGSWLGVRAILPGSGRDALGATAELQPTAERTLVRRIHTDGGYAGANDPRALFGLGGARPPSFTVRLRWPDGRVEDFANVAIGRYTVLEEGAGSRVDAAPRRAR